MNTTLAFSVENYKSIAKKKTISFIPRAITDNPQSNVYKKDKIKYLTSLAIYGANSSGKSNLIEAVNQMKYMVRKSAKKNADDTLEYRPFLLDHTSGDKPTTFELDFICNDIHYRYGFSYTAKKIVSEWLVLVVGLRRRPYFIRNEEGIGIDDTLFPEGRDLENRTNDNRLFLSLVGQLGGDISNSILSFFNTHLFVLHGLKTNKYEDFTQHFLYDQMSGSQTMKEFFQKVQLGFADIFVIKEKTEESNLEFAWKNLLFGSEYRSITLHNVYDEQGEVIAKREFDMRRTESSGTQKLFEMAGHIFDIIQRGATIFIDELDAKMHPLLSRELVSLFNNPDSNPLGAQLLFTTHDTNLLSSGLLRRDQIWFTEKDRCERTDLYNFMQIVLPDGSKPRGDGNIERNYIQGRYGAIPYITNFND